MFKNKWWILLPVAIIGLIVLFYGIKTSQTKYIVKKASTCNLNPFYQEENHKFYVECIEDIEVQKNGRRVSLIKALQDKTISLDEILQDAKGKEDQINGSIYRYDQFSILICQRIYEDHVMPNQDRIFGPKDLQIDLTKHCLQNE